MRWAATGGPNQVVTASASLYARSPTRVTYIRRAELTVVGAGTAAIAERSAPIRVFGVN